MTRASGTQAIWSPLAGGARFTSDGTRWWIEDLESANGTFVGPSAGPLPVDPIGRGRVEFAPDQRIYLGGWTRIVIRAATDDEKQAQQAECVQACADVPVVSDAAMQAVTYQ